MQTLLSDHWHAVRSVRPRLRDGVTALHRRLRGRPWVLLLDPVTQRFHRLTPQVWRVLALCDGRRTLDEVWSAACEPGAATAQQAGPISQHELVQLMSTLYANDLLQTQVSPDAGEVFERYRRQRRARLRQSWLNPLSLKLALLHPDAWFGRHAGLARALFSLPALGLWLLLVLPACFLAWQHWDALTENLSDRVLSASNVALLWITYPLVKSVHEWAHGMAVKAWGGNVREMGLMFVVFTPVPYVDATSSYAFPSKWARAAVAAAGIMAELALGAVAVVVWLLAESGWASALAFNVVLIAGVSTVLVNGNPLMRYDGYFVFCDVFEVPNLAQRAAQYWAWLIDRFGFGARDAQPPVESSGERWLLAVYGVVAPCYRLAVSLGLIWFVAGEYLFVGVVLALAAAWAALVVPAWKGWKHLSEAPSLALRREVALRRSVLLLAGGAAFVGWVPMPFHSVHQGVVWLPDEAIVRAGAAAHVAMAGVRPGNAVPAGQTLLTLENPQLLAELGLAGGAVAQTRARLRKAEVDEPVRAQALRTDLAAREARLNEAQRRVDALVVKAATAGRWAPAAPTELAGRFVKRGEVLGYVVDGPSRLVRTAVTQDDMSLIGARLATVEVRMDKALREPVGGRLSRIVPGADFDLVSPALGTSGGGDIPVDPSRREGTRSLKRVFDIEVALDHAVSGSVFGDRALVRFDLGATPLGRQWFLRLRQMFLARLDV